MTFPVLLDTKGKVADGYGIRGMPAHFLVDKKGLIRAYAPGYKDMMSRSSLNLIRFIMEDN